MNDDKTAQDYKVSSGARGMLGVNRATHPQCWTPAMLLLYCILYSRSWIATGLTCNEIFSIVSCFHRINNKVVHYL